MINDYRPLLEKVKKSVIPMGFKLDKDNDFEATFSNDSGWSIFFEGERYVENPAFELSIGANGQSFSVRLLMEVFRVDEKPSLKNQLKFIDDKYESLFVFPPPYLAEYQKVNEIGL